MSAVVAVIFSQWHASSSMFETRLRHISTTCIVYGSCSAVGHIYRHESARSVCVGLQNMDLYLPGGD